MLSSEFSMFWADSRRSSKVISMLIFLWRGITVKIPSLIYRSQNLSMLFSREEVRLMGRYDLESLYSFIMYYLEGFLGTAYIISVFLLLFLRVYSLRVSPSA